MQLLCLSPTTCIYSSYHPHHQWNKPSTCYKRGIYISHPGESSWQIPSRRITFREHPARKQVWSPARCLADRRTHLTLQIEECYPSQPRQKQAIRMHRPAAPPCLQKPTQHQCSPSQQQKQDATYWREHCSRCQRSEPVFIHGNYKRCLTFLCWSIS